MATRKGRSQHKEVERVCPGCGLIKTFPERNLTCSNECARLYAMRSDLGGIPVPLPDLIKGYLSKAKSGVSLGDLCNEFDRSPKMVLGAIDVLRGQGYNIAISGDTIAMPADVEPGSTGGKPLVHDISQYAGHWFSFGATGDNHLGSKHERLDVLNAAYDLYAGEGVSIVFNTGNWAEGDSKINFHDVKVHGLDDQIDYVLQNYPQRPGITTYFVAGDDHEGWWQKRERIEIGRHLQVRAEEAKRDDLKYLGYVEADIQLRAKSGASWIRVMHPGGGSAYAHSYAAQKIVEALQGGEKPHILLLGHYHKFDYGYPREVHVVQTGCTVDQSIFMRTHKIQAMVGFVLCRLNQADDGTINRFQVEWFPFYDRGFYGGRRNFGLSVPGAGLVVSGGKVKGGAK